MTFLISVIVPTYNGASRIARLLDALKLQSCMNYEVIIVIDGSTDNSLDVIKKNKEGLNLNIVVQKNKGRAGARNTGAKHAKGNAFIFYDDDVEPLPNSIELHVNDLKNHSITVGQQLESLDATTEFAKYKAKLSRSWMQHIKEPTELASVDLYLTAANMGIKRDVFIELNGFDERLTDAEDYDLAVRAVINGYKVWYNPLNEVVHHAFDTMTSYIQRQRQYRKAHRDLMALREHHNLYAKYHLQKSFLKSLVYFFVPGVTASLVDKEYFKFLPTNIRFSFYDRIIAALGVYFPNRKL